MEGGDERTPTTPAAYLHAGQRRLYSRVTASARAKSSARLALQNARLRTEAKARQRSARLRLTERLIGDTADRTGGRTPVDKVGHRGLGLPITGHRICAKPQDLDYTRRTNTH